MYQYLLVEGVCGVRLRVKLFNPYLWDTDLKKIIEDIKNGLIEFKADKAGTVHAGVGKVSFATEKLETNINNFVDAIIKAKPSGAKGNYFKDMYISSTMGPSLKLLSKI